MSFNFNSNNKAGDLQNLTKLQQLNYTPLENEIKSTFYPDFPKVPNPKDIIQLLLLNIFDSNKLEEMIKKETLVTDYNQIMEVIQSENKSFDVTNQFDNFFLFVCNKDIDELLFKEIPYLVKHKKAIDDKNTYKLVQLPKGSYFSINAKKKVIPHGIFLIKYSSKDKQTINKNALYMNITKNISDI